MPRFRKYGRKRTTKRYKRRTLAPKSIRRRKSATAQSKQIMALSRQVRRLNKVTYVPFQMQWGRENLSCQVFLPGNVGTPYVCPIVRNPCNPTGNAKDGPQDPNIAIWRDSLALGAQPAFSKQFVFNISDAAYNANTIYHKGSTLKWQMVTTEPQFEKVTLMLVQPRAQHAAAIVADNALNGDGTLPYGPQNGATNFKEGQDYVLQDGTGAPTSAGNPANYYGVFVNFKRWKVLYKREITFGIPNGTQLVPPAAGTPSTNTLTAHGTIKIPGMGKIENADRTSSNNSLDVSNAINKGILDMRNSDQMYLIAISSGVSGDQERLFLSWNCLDNYHAVC